MEIPRIRQFLAVCQPGSFTAAAKALQISQPSVTMGVARLERALGGPLLERRASGTVDAAGPRLTAPP